MRRLPVGRYVDIQSPVHETDPLLKLVCVFVLLACIVMSDSILQYAAVTAFLVFLAVSSRLGCRQVFGGTAGMYPFFAFIVLMNSLFFSSEDPVFSFWIFSFTMEGLGQGLTVVLRVFFALVLGNILTATTSPLEITLAIEDLIRPLRILGLPVEEVAMIIGVSIRFMPVLIEEAGMIKKAQTARGAGFESRKPGQRAKAVLPLVVPIFLSAFRRADELSVAMEARGYHRSKRIAGRKRDGRRFSAFGAVLLLSSLLLLVCEIFVF